MKVKDIKAYEEWKVNNTDPYGSAVFRYAERDGRKNCKLCLIINKLFVPTNWQYTWGVFVGSSAVGISNVFDLFLERN